MEDLLGLLIDNYQIESVLGKGGMGIVYKAYDLQLERFVAIKMLNTDTINQAKFIEKFKAEAKNQAKLQHPHIVTVYGFIEYMNFLGIIMEYVEGECLDKTIARKGAVKLEDSIYLIRQVLYAIGYAHARGFVHRDIKPSNIIISRDGIAKIMDFGISKPIFEKSFKKASGRVGTIYYMSPEQLKGMDAEVTSDIYSTGCTLFELVSGKPPFNAENEFDLVDHHLNSPPPKAAGRDNNIPPMFDSVIEKALKKQPKERYRSAEEFITDLDILEQKYIGKSGKRFNGSGLLRKNKKLYTWGALIGFTLLLLAIIYFIFTQVHDLLTSKELDKFKEYSIQSMFVSEDIKLDLIQHELENAVDIKDIEMFDNGRILISSDSGYVYSLSEGFQEETPIELGGRILGLSVLPGGTVLGIEQNRIIRSSDLFTTIERVRLGRGIRLLNLCRTDQGYLFATGTRGTIVRFSEDIQWFLSETDTEQRIFDIEFSGEKTGTAVGWNGTILRTTDGGDNWFSIGKMTEKYLKAVDFNASGDGVLVGGGGTIMISSDAGKSWREKESYTTESLFDVKFLDESTVIAVGSRGAVVISKDAGDSWHAVNNGNYHTLNKLILKNNKIYAAGNGGIIAEINL
jgi:serine/threonine-protein kinase